MKLSQIKVDAGLQLRAKLNEQAIEDYAHVLREGGKMPPVVLFHDGTTYHLADGWHRYFAHKKAGLEIIDADVREGTRRDAIYFALSANSKNGLHRSNEDKIKAVMTMLDDVEWSEQSDREIAIACDVSHPFVARLRRAAGKQPEMINVKRGDVEYKLPNAAMKEKYEPDMQPEEEDKIIEMATEMQSMVEELEASQRRLAVAAMEATPEEKKLASVKLEEMATEITSLSENNRVLRVSRDTFQNECAELKKQAMYGKRRYEKAEKEITSLQKEVDFWKDRALTAEAHLAIDKAA
jgi:chromosome segregation ATPase/uncharacterized ParB-like nuclease family protein